MGTAADDLDSTLQQQARDARTGNPAEDLRDEAQRQLDQANKPKQESWFTRGLVSPQTLLASPGHSGAENLAKVNADANLNTGLNETPAHAAIRVFSGGATRDTADVISHLLSPASLLLLATTGGLGALGETAGALGATARGLSAAGGAYFGLTGANQALTGQQPGESYADSLQRRLYGGAQAAGGAAAMKGGFSASRARVPSPERIASLEHDAAVAAQLHIKTVSMAEHDAAVAQLNRVTSRIDAAHPEGVIDATKLAKGIDAEARKLYGPGQAMPKPLAKQLDTFSDEPDIATKTGAGSIPAAKGSPAYTSIIQRLKEEGVIPDNSRLTFEQARQIKNEIARRAVSSAENSTDRAAYSIAGKRFGEAMNDAADQAGLSTEHLAGNARFRNYASIFRDGPLAKTLNGANADEIMEPLVGKNAELTRRQLLALRAPMGKIRQATDFYELAEKAKTGHPQAVARLAASPIIFGAGSAIGHPFLGLFGLPGALINSVRDYMARVRVEPAFNRLGAAEGVGAIPPKPVPSAGGAGNVVAGAADQANQPSD